MKTKKTLMIALLATAAIGLRAQEYDPFVAEGKRWNVMLSDCWFPPEPQKHTTTSYKIEGDSLFEEVLYKKVFATKYEDLTRWWLYGMVRENEEKQVFFRQWGGGQLDSEKLIYDFSMLPGDSILVWPWDGVYLYLQSMNDTILEDGRIRKKYNFNYSDTICYGCTEFWIEGVGSQLGYPGDAYLVGGSNMLLCSFENEELVWHNPYQGQCFYTNWDWDGTEENIKTEKVTIFPNPTSRAFSVEGSVKILTVFNSSGQKIYSGTTNTVDVREWPEGLYHVRVTDEDNTVRTAKLVKSR